MQSCPRYHIYLLKAGDARNYLFRHVFSAHEADFFGRSYYVDFASDLAELVPRLGDGALGEGYVRNGERVGPHRPRDKRFESNAARLPGRAPVVAVTTVKRELCTMSRRRADPLSEIGRAHWLTVSDLQRNLLSSTPLPAGTDLRAALREALEQYAGDGWQPEGDGDYGFVFVARGSERRLINLTPVNPAEVGGPGYGSSLAGRAVV